MSASLQAHIDRHGLPTEERPFHCPLPTVEEYRAFLWALYATYVSFFLHIASMHLLDANSMSQT